MKVRKLIVEDVRCFAGRQEFNIRPLTFLTGENSTGKTTALGSLQTLHDFLGGTPPGLNFNSDPYQMGTFSNIVRNSKPKINQFKIGFEAYFTETKSSVEYVLTLTEREDGVEPYIAKQEVFTPVGEIEFAGLNEGYISQIRSGWDSPLTSRMRLKEGNSENGEYDRFYFSVSDSWLQSALLALLTRFKTGVDFNRIVSEKEPIDSFRLQDEEAFEKFSEQFTDLVGFGTYEKPKRIRIEPPWMHSFAPIRSKPQRIYNQFREDLYSHGGDAPMIMMELVRVRKDLWESLRGSLKEFGKSSGLFTDVDVRKLGASSSDPFQLQIKVRGPKVNIIDVGYGVNQLLPILVHMLTDQGNTVFLMQQPEVHLHPKAQAEFSSLMVGLVEQNGNEFIIETHSDAMINRARIEIMRGKIAPQDVSLIYLEPVGNKARVHNIQFDEQANLLGAPQGYRDFFINESDKLLGLS